MWRSKVKKTFLIKTSKSRFSQRRKVQWWMRVFFRGQKNTDFRIQRSKKHLYEKSTKLREITRPVAHSDQSDWRVNKTDQSEVRDNKTDRSEVRDYKTDQSDCRGDKTDRSEVRDNKINQSLSRVCKVEQPVALLYSFRSNRFLDTRTC